MNTRLTRCLAVGFITVAAGLNSFAATRICSVYLESYAALQKQLFLGAEVFQAPQLGALPMMISMGLPGAAQMDNAKPVALHVLDVGEGETAVVIELTPSGTAEAYLQAIAGAEAKLPAPVDGLYTLENGMAARVANGRLLLTRDAEHAEACLAKGAASLPGLPTIPGVVRVSVAPATLKPMLEKFKLTLAMMPAGSQPNAEQGRLAVESMIDFYSSLLGQVESLHLGLNIQNEGFFIRSRYAAKPGSDIASLMASIKPLSPTQLAFLEKDSLFSFAVGSYVMPPALERQVVSFYTKMASASPLYDASMTNDMAVIMSQSMEALGASMAFTGNMPTNSTVLLVQGEMGVANPTAYLNEQLAMMKTPAFKRVMEQSGMTMGEPTTRMHKGMTVYTWKSLFDEKSLEKAMRSSLPTNLPPEQLDAALKGSMASIRGVMNLFGSGFEYVATPKALAFGMGSPAMVEQAAARVLAAPAASSEAERIRGLLAPSAAPYFLGRLSLTGLMGMSFALQPEETRSVLPAIAPAGGDGIVFANWVSQGESLSALLVTASEIKAITSFVQAAQAKAMGNAASDAGQDPGAPAAAPKKPAAKKPAAPRPAAPAKAAQP